MGPSCHPHFLPIFFQLAPINMAQHHRTDLPSFPLVLNEFMSAIGTIPTHVPPAIGAALQNVHLAISAALACPSLPPPANGWTRPDSSNRHTPRAPSHRGA
jgi:hypothetical protein